jgi:uncharacterized protein
VNFSRTIALVTGASSGIGAATAELLARRGARVLLLARSAEGLARVAGRITAAGGEARCVALDLSEAQAVERVLGGVLEAEGKPQIVVNSAGAGRWLYTEETSPEEALAMMGAPYLAAFYVTRLCLPEMLRRRAGYIVNINSPVARGGWPGAAGYTAARYALQGFTNALRYDLHGTGVRVVSIVPGLVSSPYFDHNPGVTARLPALGRLLGTITPEQVARGVVSAIEHNRREVVLPLMLRAYFVINAFAPRLVEWAILRTSKKRA